MSPVLEVTVPGLALWNPTERTRPQPTLLPANERRRAPDTVAVALEVAQGACAQAGLDPAQLATVFASTYGDLSITDYMCRTLATAPGTLSPTRFHNSVHNAAAGYWTIATGCHEPYGAIGAGRYTFAAGLFSAVLQVCADATDVLYVAYDIEAQGVQTRIAASRGVLGIAMVLGHESAAGRGPRLRLSLIGRDAEPEDAGPWTQANAMSACLPLVAAMRTGAPTQLTLPSGPTSALALEILP